MQCDVQEVTNNKIDSNSNLTTQIEDNNVKVNSVDVIEDEHHEIHENENRQQCHTFQDIARERDCFDSRAKERLEICALLFGATDAIPLDVNWNSLTRKEQRRLINSIFATNLPKLTPNLTNIVTGYFYHGDCGRSPDDKPDWLDMDKFLRGQKFARDHYFGINFAQLLSLFILFSFDHGLKTLIITKKSSTPYTSFKRYLSTGIRIRNWYTENPWEPGTTAYKDIQVVRRMHSLVRARLRDTPSEEIQEASKIKNPMCPMRETLMNDLQTSCPAPGPGQCPYLVFNNTEYSVGSLNQGEMSSTQFGFFGLVLLYPQAFGIHNASESDFEAFCHTWKGLGYLLGIDDEFNFCSGTLEEIRQRCSDFMNLWVKPNFRQITPEWEHMMRCVVEGLQYYFPGSSYEVNFLYLTDMMNLHMPRLYKSLSFMAWIKYQFLKFLFYFTMRIPGLCDCMNKRLNTRTNAALNFSAEQLSTFEEKSNETLKKYTVNNQKYQTELTAEDKKNYNKIVIHHL